MAIDSSGSMTRLGWEQAVNFTASLFFQSFEVSASCVRAALLSFGTDAYLYSLLTQGTNQLELTNSLNVMRQEFRNEWTNTGAAIKLMSDVIFTSANGDREGVQNVGGGGGGFQNLQDVRRELKLEQQRLRQEEEGNNEEDLWSQKIRTEPLDAEEAFSELKEEHAVNASVPSKLASPRLDDDPDNPLRKQKLEPPPPPSREMQHVKQMVEDGLLKMEQKMDSLERKIATVNKNASLIRGYRAEEELKKDLQNALRSEAQSSDKEQIPDNSERIKDLPSPQALVESEGPPKSFVHPPRPQLAAGSPVADAAALRDSLEFRPFRRGDEESPRLAGEATF